MKKILILSANPINTSRLRLDEEVREIQQALERAQNREAFELITRGAVRIDDLRRTLLDSKPIIVHFSGHGTESNDLVLENISGEPQTVNPESLSQLFELCKEQIECVLLNACYSEIQAEAIHRHIDCVIGMVQPIQDSAAINFSKGFYDAIFSGRNYADAFRFGCNNIDLNNIPSSNTPTIKIRHKVLPPPPTVITNTHKRVIGTAVFGLSAALVGLVQLVSGNAGVITNILLVFGSLTLWVCCVYIYFPSSRIFGFGVTPLSSPKQYKRLRRLVLAGMIIIPILSATGFYVWQLPPKNIIVLLADIPGRSFQGHDLEYNFLRNIFNKLEDACQKYSDIEIHLLNQVVTPQMDARKVGEQHKVTIFIWGDYAVTETNVQLSLHFEVLRPPKDLPEIGRLEQIAPVSELNSFKLQGDLSSEIAYLSLFTVGLTRYTASDWDQAINEFSDALRQVKDPIKELDQSIVYLYQGNAYAHLRDYKRAIVDYTQAIKFNPNYALAYDNRGSAYAQLKDYHSAIVDYTQAIKLNPSDTYAYRNRGIAYAQLENYKHAIVDYTQAIKLNPSDTYAYRNRGIAYAQLENYKHAIVDYTQAIKLDPSNANTYRNRGIVYAQLKDYHPAIVDYTQAIKLNPSDADAYRNRGIAYTQLKDYNCAIADSTLAIKLNPSDAEAYDNRGYAYIYKQDYNRAITDSTQAIKLNPLAADAYDTRCEAYVKEGDNDRAIIDCTQAIKLDSTYTNSYYNRGIAYRKKSSRNQAVEDFKKVLELNNNVELIQNAKQQLQELSTSNLANP